LALDPRTGIEHVAVEHEALLEVPDLGGHDLTHVNARLELGDDAEPVHVGLPLLVDSGREVEEDANAVGVSHPSLFRPRQYHLVAHVLVDLPRTVEDRSSQVSEELVDEAVVRFGAQRLGQRR
jgi:hypothetical protein